MIWASGRRRRRRRTKSRSPRFQGRNAHHRDVAGFELSNGGAGRTIAGKSPRLEATLDQQLRQHRARRLVEWTNSRYAENRSHAASALRRVTFRRGSVSSGGGSVGAGESGCATGWALSG